MEMTQEIEAKVSGKRTTRPNYKFQRDKDREMVKGIFRFYEVPGGTMSFSIKIWKEDEVENFTLRDGAVYTIPLGVAKHLNKNCWYPIHSHASDENGITSMKVGQRVRRMGFSSLEFTDIEDLMDKDGNSIIEHIKA